MKPYTAVHLAKRLERFGSIAYRHPCLCEAALIPVALVGIFWIFLGKYLGGEHAVATFQDNTHFILPLFTHISKSFAAGEFPYWINTIAGGVPLYNTPQFSLLYPFYFFGLNLYRTPLDAALHVHYVTLLHVGILWMNTYVMMRIFKLRVISSIVGATLFAFCANTFEYLFWVNIISPYSWFPLALASVVLVLENEYPKTGLVLGWISIYLLTSASPSQPLIHFIFCSLALVVSYAIPRRQHISKLVVPIRNLIILALGAILLSSATLIPTVVFAQRDMVRWTEVGPIVGNQRVPFEAFVAGQTKVGELAKVLFPLDVQQATGNSYLGILPVFLALFGLFRSKQNWIIMPFLVLAIYTLLSSTGDNLGLAYLNHAIPLWNKIREPGRHLYIFCLAACTLAAFGFEHFIDHQTFHRFKLQKHAYTFGVFLIILIAGYWVRQKYETVIGDSTLLWSFVLFLGVSLITHVLPQLNRLRRGLLAAIVLYPAVCYPAPIVRITEGDYFQEENLRSHRVLQEISKIKDIANYRLIVGDDRFSPQFWSMNGAYYGLRTFEAFMNPLPFGQVREMFMAPGLPRYAQLLGAKYYLNCRDSTSELPGYTFDRQIEGCKFYSAADAQPHYFLSAEVALSFDDVQEFLNRILQSNADLSKVAVNSKDVQEITDWLGHEAGAPVRSQIFREDRSLNTLSLGLTANRVSLLVLNEYFRNDWRATVNGKSQKLFKVNLNQIGVLLPAGTSEVHFEYQPRLFVWLVRWQKIALAILVVAMVAMALFAKRKTPLLS